MKIWMGYGSEHSANLVIIGKFESVQTAQAAADLLESAREVARADEASGILKPGEVKAHFSEGVMGLFTQYNLSLNYGDPEQLLYEYNVKREDDRLIVTTDELDVQAILKILLHEGAKVEVYSAHEHGGLYGRRTRS